MNKKMLIFEDDSDTAEIAGIVATQLGFDVAYRSETVDVVKDVLMEAPDLIIMDNWIRGEGGLSAINRLKSTPSTSQIPIIFYSASTDFTSIAKGSKAEGFLTKPFELEDLERMIVDLVSKY